MVLDTVKLLTPKQSDTGSMRAHTLLIWKEFQSSKKS
uniref:Uncharacterized protein n=1 Tax=Anguilla anguilla TaxID=7936 RepID=A0A0E9TSE5_ANGAN